jgi:hypothetical protein
MLDEATEMLDLTTEEGQEVVKSVLVYIDELIQKFKKTEELDKESESDSEDE